VTDTVSKKAAAAFFGVSVQALDGWFTAGCPVAERDAHGAVKRVSLAAMTRWRIKRPSKAKHLPTPDESETELREQMFARFIGLQFLPAVWQMLFTGGVGMLIGRGLSKADALASAVDLTHLIHHATEEFFRGRKIPVEYSDQIIAIAVAQRDGTLDAWVREHWPDAKAQHGTEN
jgi:hypothetical protein